MDKQTAIDLLDNLLGMVEDNNESDYDTALKMGIEALDADKTADDAISRGAVNDLLKDLTKKASERATEFNSAYAYYRGAISDVYYGVKELPSAQPQRWIPVTQELPDRYIVGGDGKHYSQDVLMTVIYRDDDIFIDYGQMVDDEWYSEMDKEIITSPFEVVAWMHLPKPYRGGQDETRGVSETS